MPPTSESVEGRLEILRSVLSPSQPVRSTELLKGRSSELDTVINIFRVVGGTPLIYGNRGVGKTSLARTAAQEYTHADREHIYVACPPGASIMPILRDVAIRFSDLAFDTGAIRKGRIDVEATIGISPSVKFAYKARTQEAPAISDINEAIRIIQDFDSKMNSARQTVVIIDELDQLAKESRPELAFFIKELGDQDISTRFALVGIADSVGDLIDAHQSISRYIHEVELEPLRPQSLIDIVKEAADRVGIIVSSDILIRIAIIGNGYPHFAHLMGMSLLTEAINADKGEIDNDTYIKGVRSAVKMSIQELKASYNQATQRKSDDYRNVLWTMADMDTVDLRIDQTAEHYTALARRQGWRAMGQTDVTDVLTRLRSEEYGTVIAHTPIQYGDREKRYRHHRFANNLMRGHIRLRAEEMGTSLGSRVTP